MKEMYNTNNGWFMMFKERRWPHNIAVQVKQQELMQKL